MTETKPQTPEFDLSNLEPHEIKKLARNARVLYRDLRPEVHEVYVRKFGSRYKLTDCTYSTKVRLFAGTAMKCMFAEDDGPEMSWPNYFLNNINKSTKTAAEKRLEHIARENNLEEAVRKIMVLTDYLHKNGNGVGRVDPKSFFEDLCAWNAQCVVRSPRVYWLEYIYSNLELEKNEGE